MRQILFRAVLLLASWAIGLLIAAWVIPGVSLSVSGFIVAVVVFSVGQAMLSLLSLKLPHGYASLLLGGTGLALTVIALSPRLSSNARAHRSRHGVLGGHDACGVARDNDRGHFTARAVRPRRGRLGLTNSRPGTPEPCIGDTCKFGYRLGARRNRLQCERVTVGPRRFDEVYAPSTLVSSARVQLRVLMLVVLTTTARAHCCRRPQYSPDGSAAVAAKFGDFGECAGSSICYLVRRRRET